MATRIKTGSEIEWSPPQVVWETDYIDTPMVSYDVSSDGQYLYVVKSSEEIPSSKLHVIENWFEELKQRVPTGKN